MTGYTCPECQCAPESLIPSPIPKAYPIKEPLPLTDKDSIQQSIADASRSVSSLRNLIGSLESSLASCRSSLADLEDFVMDQKSALGIKRLPDDILREIFRWVPFGLWKQDAITFRSATPRSSPLVLTHVSRKWRDIAVRTPSLWTDIDLSFGNRVPPSKLSLLSMWLTRSATAPIDIIFVVRPDAVNLMDAGGTLNSWAALTSNLRVLIQYQDRWKTAHLQLLSVMYTDSGIFPLSRTTRLKSVKFVTLDGFFTKWVTPLLAQCGVPLSIEMQNFHPLISQEQPIVPWSSVRRLNTVTHVPQTRWVHDYEDVLNTFKVLKSLEALHAAFSPLNSTNVTVIRHATLRVLQMHTGSASILNFLDLPALEELCMDYVNVDSPTLNAFTSRSPHLSKIRLCNSDAECLTGLTLETNKVFELRFICFHQRQPDGTYPVQKLLGTLAKMSSQTPIILQKLTDVELSVKFPDGEDNYPPLIMQIQNTLLSLWRERAKTGDSQSGLRNLVLRFEGRLSEFTLGVVSHLREMAIDGFSVQTGF